jgi:hypothetical protein
VIFTRPFWLDALERAIKTAAQTAVAMIGAAQVNVLDLPAAAIAGVSLTAAIVSVLTSVASAGREGTISPASTIKEN